MTTYVLVGDARPAGWCWQRVSRRREITAATALDFAGPGGGPHSDRGAEGWRAPYGEGVAKPSNPSR